MNQNQKLGVLLKRSLNFTIPDVDAPVEGSLFTTTVVHPEHEEMFKGMIEKVQRVQVGDMELDELKAQAESTGEEESKAWEEIRVDFTEHNKCVPVPGLCLPPFPCACIPTDVMHTVMWEKPGQKNSTEGQKAGTEGQKAGTQGRLKKRVQC
jgi:hypothetical protein